MNSLDRLFWAAFLSIAIIGAITWLAILENNYHPRIYRYSEDVTILQVGEGELDLDHPKGLCIICWQSGRRNVRVWPRWLKQVDTSPLQQGEREWGRR